MEKKHEQGVRLLVAELTKHSNIIEMRVMNELGRVAKNVTEVELRMVDGMERRHKNMVQNGVTQQKTSRILLDKVSAIDEVASQSYERVSCAEKCIDMLVSKFGKVDERLSRIEEFIDTLVACEDKNCFLDKLVQGNDYLCEIGRVEELIFDLNKRLDCLDEKLSRRNDRNSTNMKRLHAFICKKHNDNKRFFSLS